MDEIKQITSLQNALVKKIVTLREKSRERKKTGLFVLEGRRELQLALKARYQAETIICCPDLIPSSKVLQLLGNLKTNPQIVQISREIYQKLAYREGTEGLLALMHSKTHTLDTLNLKKQNPLILVAEAPEKPGNIGALLRTADAAKLDAVIIANPKTDLYNPNVIRSSVGCVFTNTVVQGGSSEVIDFLKAETTTIYCAALSASKNYLDCNFTGASAIVVGTEADGLSETWLQNSSQNIIIPMQGAIDSMNVSVSAAILIFEAKRQRRLL